LIESTSFSSGVDPTKSDNGPLYKPNISALDHSTTADKTLFASFYIFQEFDLIEKKELAPLQELIERLTSIGGMTGGGGAHSIQHSANNTMEEHH